MKNVKRILKSLATKDSLSGFIDIYYGINVIQIRFFKFIMLIAGILLLSTLEPKSYLHTYLNDGGLIIQQYFNNGEIYGSLLIIYIFCEILEVFFLLPRWKDNLFKIIGIFGGTICLFYIIKFIIFSVDMIIYQMLYFLVVKVIFTIITKSFHISTKYFGYYIKSCSSGSGRKVENEESKIK